MFKKFLNFLGILLIWGFFSVDGKADASSVIKIENAWIRESSGPNAALFMTMTNLSDQTQALIGAHFEVCASAELHTHKEEKGGFRMRPVELIEIPPQGRQELKSGGYHVMLLNLRAPLKEGDQIPVVLYFKGKKPFRMSVLVRGMGQESPCPCSE